MNKSKPIPPSIIRELWYGNIQPWQRGIPSTPVMQSLLDAAAVHSEELEKTLTEQQKNLLIQINDEQSKYECLYEAEIFAYAFRLGARMMMEILNENEP